MPIPPFFSGFGQPDIFYPKNLEGKWEVEQTYTDISGDKKSVYFVELLSNMQQNENNILEKSTNEKKNINKKENKNLELGGEEKIKKVQNPVKIKFNSNYINVKDNVVLDRSFFQTNKYNSVLRNQDEIGKITAIAKWDFTNPNILSLMSSDGKVCQLLIFIFMFFLCFYV